MKIRRQLLIALSVLVAGGLFAFAIIKFSPQTEQQKEVIKPPVVQFIEVKLESLRIDVHAHGRVMAHTEIDLVAEVSGNIVDVSPAFVSGGFFRKGDLLIAVDPADYELKVAQSLAKVSEARYQLIREEAEAEQAREEWQHIGQGEPSPLNHRIPQLAEKRAKLAAEKVALENAKLLRQRTEIRAPFDGRVRTKMADIGQYLTRGIALGTIYNSELAEVRLPLSNHALALVDFPAAVNGSHSSKVVLHAMHLGQKQTWHGHIVRSEGVVDENTGMITVVAQVPDPFGLIADESNAVKQTSVELPLGLFVEAMIEGRWFDNLVVLPSSVLLNDNQVAIIDIENRLRLRTVAVLKHEAKQVIINAGLNTGEQVLVAGMLRPIEGLHVIPQLSTVKNDYRTHMLVKKEKHIDVTASQ